MTAHVENTRSMLTHVENAADGFAAAAEGTGPGTPRTRRSTGRSARNATTSSRLTMRSDGKQSSELKKELAEWRIHTTSAKRKMNGEDGCASTRRGEIVETERPDLL